MNKINIIGELNSVSIDKIIARASQIYDDNSKSFVSSILANKADKTALPTKVSQLTNDSKYLTNNTLYEANLQWGGKNFDGGYSPLDAAMIPELCANRFAFANPKGITVEYSDNNGTTWKDYGLNDNDKLALISIGNVPIYISGNSSVTATASSQLRIIFDTNKCNIYTILHKFCLYISTSGSNNCTVSIYKALQSTPDVYEPVVENVNIRGWRNYNIINFPPFYTSYDNNQPTHYCKIKFIFKIGSQNINYKGLNIWSIQAFGGAADVVNSNLAKYGILYRIDAQQNAIFPNKVYAKSFLSSDSSLVSNSNLWATDGSIVKKSDLLNGYATQSWVTDQGYKTADTWRGITDSYNGTDSATSLSQKGANDLYNILSDGYADVAGEADEAKIVTNGNISIVPNANNTINFGGTSKDTYVYFGLNATDSRPAPTNFYFGSNGNGAYLNANGFVKKNSSASYVLTGNGGHKAVSDFAAASHTHAIAVKGTATINGISGGSNGFMSGEDKTFIEAAKKVQVWMYPNDDTNNSSETQALLNSRKATFAEGWDDLSVGVDNTTVKLPMASDSRAGCVTANLYKRVNGYKFTEDIEPGYGGDINADLAFTGTDCYDRIEMPYQSTDLVIYRLAYVSYNNCAIYLGCDIDGTQYKLKVQNDGTWSFIQR